MDHDRVIAAILNWESDDVNVRAVVLTGSAVGQQQHVLSDRDIELHVREAGPLEGSDSWWSGLGEVIAVERLEDGEGRPTRLVYYAGGKLDFTLVEGAARRTVYERPFAVLLDKDGTTAAFTLRRRQPGIPSQSSFGESCNWASAAALMAARAVLRDEPWSMMTRDVDLKAELLRMIEWDHNLRYGGDRDVRYHGTRMRSWMDEEIQKRLETCGAPLGPGGRDAILSAAQLFSELAGSVARNADLVDFDHAAVRAELERILGHALPVGSR